MKKILQEETEGLQPDEKPSETNQNAAGRSGTKFLIYLVIILVVVALIYLLTRYNNNTFKINS